MPPSGPSLPLADHLAAATAVLPSPLASSSTSLCPVTPQGRRMRSAGDQRGHEGVVPGGGFALALEAGFQRGVGAREVERDLAEQGQVPGGGALAYSACIFVETDVEYPVDPVLDRPMASDGGRELCWG